MNLLKSLCLFILLLTLSMAQYTQAQENTDRGYIVKVGQMAPELTFKYLDGSTKNLSEFRGKVVMLQFTASWCSVCRKEMPYIEHEIWQPNKDKDLVVIGIDRGEAAGKLPPFIKATGITYPLTLDEDLSIFKQFALEKSGVTRNVIIDKNGKIVLLTRLFDRKEFNKMKQIIHQLLNPDADQ